MYTIEDENLYSFGLNSEDDNEVQPGVYRTEDGTSIIIGGSLDKPPALSRVSSKNRMLFLIGREDTQTSHVSSERLGKAAHK